MKGGILRASTCDQAEANTSRVPEFEGWDSLLDDESRCVNQQVTNETVSSFAASVSSFSMPACLIRSSGSPETVIFLSRAPGTGALLRVQVPPQVDHSE